MRSAQDGHDLTARARIRDAAIACFAADGIARTSVRTIAAAAGVSPALVIHHFGSKESLHAACDEHVARLLYERKATANAAGVGLDPLAALRQVGTGLPVLRYLARTLTEGAAHTAALVDTLVSDAASLARHGEQKGTVRPYADEHARAAVLSIWTLGALVLSGHLQRLLGEDIIDDPSHASRYVAAAVDILGRGVFTEGMYARLSQDFAPPQTPTPPSGQTQEG